MARYSIDRSKSNVSEIKERIQDTQKRWENLESLKQKILYGGIDLESANMDEEARIVLSEGLRKAREKITERGKELSSELNEDKAELEEISQETSDVQADTEAQLRSSEQKRMLLDKVGLGGSLDNAINKMDSSIGELSDLQSNISDATNELTMIQMRLNDL